MELKPTWNDGRAERLALWIREMDFADQMFITSTTLVLESIRVRRNDLPVAFDEANFREGTAREAYRHTIQLADAYAQQPSCVGEDGVDEHWRISNLARGISERIAKCHPEVLEGDR